MDLTNYPFLLYGNTQSREFSKMWKLFHYFLKAVLIVHKNRNLYNMVWDSPVNLWVNKLIQQTNNITMPIPQTYQVSQLHNLQSLICTICSICTYKNCSPIFFYGSPYHHNAIPEFHWFGGIIFMESGSLWSPGILPLYSE